MEYFIIMTKQKKQFWDGKYLDFRKVRDSWFKPVSELLLSWNITPNMLTTFRLFLAAIIPVLIGWNYWVVVILMALNLLLDAVDGSMARISKQSTYKGKLYDLITDNLTFVLFLLGLIFWRLSDGFITAFYLVNFIVAIFFGLQFQNLKEDQFVMSQSRYVLLVAFLLLAISGLNWLDYGSLLCGVYLFVCNIFLGHKLISKS